MRRDPGSGLSAPILTALKVLSAPVLLTIAAVEIPFMNRFLITTDLTGRQWVAALGLSLILPIVVEVEKLVRRLIHHTPPPTYTTAEAVLPNRARAAVAAPEPTPAVALVS